MSKGKKSVETREPRIPPAAGAAKRNRAAKKVQQTNIKRIAKATIRRPARRGGERLISDEVMDTLRIQLHTFVEGIIRDLVKQAEHDKRKSISAVDVVNTLRKRGKALYGI